LHCLATFGFALGGFGFALGGKYISPRNTTSIPGAKPARREALGKAPGCLIFGHNYIAVVTARPPEKTPRIGSRVPEIPGRACHPSSFHLPPRLLASSKMNEDQKMMAEAC